jgi:hypothetical protein
MICREKRWRIIGMLQLPRAGFPSIGNFGGKLFVIGGKAKQDDNLQATDSIEGFCEAEGQFQQDKSEESIGQKTLKLPRYRLRKKYIH